MDSIVNMYNTLNHRSISASDLSYTPHKFYLDPLQIKNEKEKKANKYMKDKSTKKLDMLAKKGTFLEQIQKRQKSLPCPNSYSPKQYSPTYKDRKFSNLPERKTIFQDINRLARKFKSPGPLEYENEKLKSKSTQPFDKADNQTFLDSQMSKDCRLPGVGQYNACRQKYDKTFGKWNLAKRAIDKECKQNIPSSCTYSPHKIDKKLFSELAKIPKKNSVFQKQKRFNRQKDNGKSIFYTKLSEWGMQTNYKKKDILSKLSTHNSYSKSVYYN